MPIFDKAYPTFDNEGNETEWVAVAVDPSSFTYYEEDAEAIDRTNYEALKAYGFEPEAEWIAEGRDRYGFHYFESAEYPKESEWAECKADAFAFESNYYSDKVPFSYGTTVLFVRKPRRQHEEWSDETNEWLALRWIARTYWGFDHEADTEWNYFISPTLLEADGLAYEQWEDCSRSLADYPLLDEDAYSSLEWEAWQRSTDSEHGYVLQDTVNAVADSFAQRWSDEHEAISETLEEHYEEWYYEALQSLDYFYGFSAEYDSKSLEASALSFYLKRKRSQLRAFAELVSEGCEAESASYFVRHCSTRLLTLAKAS